MASKNEKPRHTKLAAKLKKARSAAKLTQAQVATKAGVHVNFYARLERGEVDVNFERLESILKALGVDSIQID